MEVFAVYFNGHLDGYGREMFCMGIFSTREEAQQAIANSGYDDVLTFDIVGMTLGEALPISENIEYNEYSTDTYIGGYCE